MKRIITAALAAALLTALTGAYAGEAGTAADPLVTKTYIDTTYTASVIAAGETLIDQSLAEISAAIGLLLLPDDRPPMKYTSGPETFVAGQAGSVTLGPGSSLILTGGSAVLSVLSGQVIDISTGEAVESGASLSALKRYFCTEGTFADLTLAPSSTFVLDGPYSPGEGIIRPYALYSDVSGTEWFGDAARYAHENKIFFDWDAQRFRPDEPAVRAEVIYAIWVLAGSPRTDFVSPFTDLSEDWYVMAANWAFEQGITNGSGNLEIFGPHDNISREQLALAPVLRQGRLPKVGPVRFLRRGDHLPLRAGRRLLGRRHGLYQRVQPGRHGPALPHLPRPDLRHLHALLRLPA